MLSVYPCVPVCTRVYPCVPVCTRVYPCVPVCTRAGGQLAREPSQAAVDYHNVPSPNVLHD